MPVSRARSSAESEIPAPPQLSEMSDADLTDLSRLGDDDAFAELWSRHSAAGLAASRQFADIASADDLVTEAYLRILSSIRRGGGPTDAFRTYLYRTIRNLAMDWAKPKPAVSLDEAEGDLPDPRARSADAILDRTVLAQAFATLPKRWREVLWQLEVQQMTPAEVAPLLDLTPNGVSALGVRAREGLRRAWLQAHANDRNVPEGCRWTTERVGVYARRGLSRRAQTRFEIHLARCARCEVLVGEIRQLDTGIAMGLLPILLAAGGAASYLSIRGEGAAVQATDAGSGATSDLISSAEPATSFSAGAGGSTATMSHSAALGARLASFRVPGLAGISSTVGAAAAIAVVCAGVAFASLGGWNGAVPASSIETTEVAPEADTDPPRDPVPVTEPGAAEDPESAVEVPARPTPPTTTPVVEPQPQSPAPLPPADTTAPEAPVLTTTFPGTIDWLPTLTGTGEPDATVTITDAGGVVLGSAKVAADGAWSTGILDPRHSDVTLRLAQADQAGNVSSVAEHASALRFRVPAVAVAPLADQWSMEVSTEAIPDALLEISVDGVSVTHPSDGSNLSYVIDGSSQEVVVRYLNTVTGAVGASVVVYL